MSAGTVTTGAVVSWTVTWNDADELFPAASAAVHVTVVVPSGNVEPDAGVQLELVTPTASVNVTVNPTGAPDALVASAVTSAGTPIAGAVVSWTVTWNDAVAVLPLVSVAVHVTVVVPSGKVDPLAGVQPNVATATSSVALAE
jgi:hypothetical protein